MDALEIHSALTCTIAIHQEMANTTTGSQSSSALEASTPPLSSISGKGVKSYGLVPMAHWHFWIRSPMAFQPKWKKESIYTITVVESIFSDGRD